MLYVAAGVLAGGSALFLLACRLLPGLADGWMTAVFAPVSGALSGLSGRCSFAVAEPLALLLAALFVFLLFRSRRGACLLLSVVLAGYAFLWAPAYFATQRYAVGEVDASSLTAVCAELVENLNTYGAFTLPDDVGERALEVAALADTPVRPAAAPKYARYPEWMRALSLAGLYVPWTFEALLNPDEPPAGQPFTAVHELMHLGGVADEGQANICAYEACRRAGGAFAYSADLWALKYALEALRALDATAGNAFVAALSVSVRADFFAIGGVAQAASARGGVAQAFLQISGIGAKTDSYGALAAWLCDTYV